MRSPLCHRARHLAAAVSVFVVVLVVVNVIPVVGAEPAAPSAKLLAHWPLRDDARDVVGAAHGTPRDVRFAGGAARFNGVSSRVEVADADALDIAARDFSISMWVRCETPMASTLGDLLS